MIAHVQYIWRMTELDEEYRRTGQCRALSSYTTFNASLQALVMSPVPCVSPAAAAAILSTTSLSMSAPLSTGGRRSFSSISPALHNTNNILNGSSLSISASPSPSPLSSLATLTANGNSRFLTQSTKLPNRQRHSIGSSPRTQQHQHQQQRASSVKKSGKSSHSNHVTTPITVPMPTIIDDTLSSSLMRSSLSQSSSSSSTRVRQASSPSLTLTAARSYRPTLSLRKSSGSPTSLPAMLPTIANSPPPPPLVHAPSSTILPSSSSSSSSSPTLSTDSSLTHVYDTNPLASNGVAHHRRVSSSSLGIKVKEHTNIMNDNTNSTPLAHPSPPSPPPYLPIDTSNASSSSSSSSSSLPSIMVPIVSPARVHHYNANASDTSLPLSSSLSPSSPPSSGSSPSIASSILHHRAGSSDKLNIRLSYNGARTHNNSVDMTNIGGRSSPSSSPTTAASLPPFHDQLPVVVDEYSIPSHLTIAAATSLLAF
jgi:hypothetical protein